MDCSLSNQFSAAQRFIVWAAFLAFAAGGHGQERIAEKIKRLNVSRIQLESATLSEAVAELRVKSREPDGGEPDPATDAINFVVNVPEGVELLPRITLDLQEVPFMVALKAITDVAGCRYRVEPFYITVISPEAETQFYTRVFQVAPSFAPMAAPAEPRENDQRLDTVELSRRETAEEVLQKHGVDLPEGSSAHFNTRKSQLIVRSTAAALDRVQSFIISSQVSVQALISATVEIYGLPASEAQAIVGPSAEPVANATSLVDQLKLRVGAGKAKLVTTQILATKSGQRAMIQNGQSMEYIGGYENKDGMDEAVRHTAFAGTQVVFEPIKGSDGFTIDVNISISHSGDPKQERLKSVAPVSGKEVEINTVTLAQQNLKTSITASDGVTSFLGKLSGPKNGGEEARLVFLKVWLTDPAGGLLRQAVQEDPGNLGGRVIDR